jgi:hypothetical protein
MADSGEQNTDELGVPLNGGNFLTVRKTVSCNVAGGVPRLLHSRSICNVAVVTILSRMTI